jgi:hypothetical protein
MCTSGNALVFSQIQSTFLLQTSKPNKGKRGSSSISIKGVLVGSPAPIPLGRLVINLLSRFSGYFGANESNHFLEQRRRIVSDDNITNRQRR